MEAESRSYRWGPVQELIFLDRYSPKAARDEIAVGDIVVVMTSDDRRHPAKEVGVVEAVEGGEVVVRLKVSGEVIRRPLSRCDKPVETRPEQMWDRLARAAAKVEAPELREKLRDEFRWLLDGFRFVPGGRINLLLGSGQNLTAYNCYVIPVRGRTPDVPADSRHAIIDTLGNMVETMARGGGVGINLSVLRPHLASVKGVNGKSSGSVSWGALFSFATGLVEQGGSRRGALMLILNVWHPDIVEFINAKRDFSAITNANISVGITEEFEQALEQDAQWELVFPETTDPDYDRVWDGDLKKWKAMGKPVRVYQRVRARDLFRQIVESAWASAEPGFVRLDYANKMSNSWYYAPLISTNPCFAGSVRLATSKGYLTFEELYHSEEPLQVLTDARVRAVAMAPVAGNSRGRISAQALRQLPTGVEVRPAVHVFLTRRNAPVFRLKTVHGYEVIATADHRFLTPAGWVELKDLTPGQTLFLQSGPGAWSDERRLPPWIIDEPAVLGKLNARIRRGDAHPPEEWSAELGQVLGWLTGDGYTYDDNGKPVVTLVFGPGERARLPRFRELLKSWFGVSGNVTTRNHTAALQLEGIPARFFRNLGMRPVKASEKRVPDSIWRAPKDAVVGFLQGLFTSDGTVNISCHGKSCSIRLTSSSEQLLKDVQLLLLNLGIVSRVYKRRDAAKRPLPGSDRSPACYPVQSQWELVLDKENRDRFARSIGFLEVEKQKKVRRYIESKLRETHLERFVTKVASVEPAGFEDVYDTTEPVTHSIIANGLVAHQCAEQPLPAWGVCLLGHLNLARFVENGEVKWAELGKAARLGVRFLDNVIDITPYFFEENERQQKMERRVGMGTMGLAEMLIHLGIRYGSPEAIAFVDRLYGFISREAYLASVELAKEKGPFPAFDAEKYLQSGFMKTMPEDVREAIRAHGIRNVTLLTQAPTGTTGTMAATSTGIEPYYAWSYWRQGRLGRKEIFEPVVQEYLDAHPELGGDVKRLPPYFVTALELTPEEHVRMQAAIQRWVDSALSKTANLPSHYTVDQTLELYELAIKLGCKGVTIYRDKSRDEQVLVAKDEGTPGSEQTGVTSEQVASVRREAATSGSPLDVEPRAVIGEVPEEVEGFTYRQKTLVGTARVVVNEYPKGQPFETIIVLGKGGMDITADAEAIGRLISLYLRTPSPISNLEKLALVVEQLRNIGGAQPFGFGPNKVLSMPDALAKALERYLHTRRHEPGEEGSREKREELPPASTGKGQHGPSEPGASSGRHEGSGAKAESTLSASGAAGSGTNPGGPERAAGGPATRDAAARERPGQGSDAPAMTLSHRPGDLHAAEEPLHRNGHRHATAGADICPMCGQAQYVRIEGCGYCQNCGYSRC
ncbi:LAGLIDADG family homing endonuclease [Carboxydochorda subterranea]|uniref:Vitamin B12-dependent ribonucleotide reductase n=1 Tax=Carboxydichorda subterranea TaxID=3109565 RepID=A0ABZ1BX52_9FIRM|nr:LAGLIDADG family homing endonuclease [Limnochorda sp. L945t]WRP17379.1 LAGLIDADG family homing endonuclease [Limnochorda sp. L945t]